tara:strand:+ start:7038 stop:9095 length:2058 start_codon:yes stop_codon:yes gene_type:complete
MSVDDKKPTIIGQMRSFAGKHWAKLSGLDQMERVLAVTTWLAVTSFVMLAMLMDPVISGDGHYYFGMIRGFATHGSPALTEDVAAFVQGQTGRTLGQATFTTADGSVFGIHFFFYSLLCVPAYWLLDMLGMDTLKAFQLTNAFMISAALLYVRHAIELKPFSKMLLAAFFLLSTGSLYFQFTSAEIFSATLLLAASACFLDRRYAWAVALVAVSSLQNPSSILLIAPIMIGYWLELREQENKAFLSVSMFRKLAFAGAFTVIGLAPYAWFHLLTGHFSVIVDRGYIDYNLISPRRFASFLFDLNQGLIVGAPFLVILSPAILFFRAMRAGSWLGMLKRSDLLLLGFLLVMLPTLGQNNWNAGLSLFLRYAAWTAPILFVWAAAECASLPTRATVPVLAPALSLQILLFATLGGISLEPMRDSTTLKPWVETLWETAPHVYNPDAEIFVERVQERKEKMRLPQAHRDKYGNIVKVLSENIPVAEISRLVCDQGSALQPVDGRRSSRLKMMPANRGLRYVTGRLECFLSEWQAVTFPLSGGQSPAHAALGPGWARAENWGRWSYGDAASLRLFLNLDEAEAIKIGVSGRAFCRPEHPEQAVEVIVNGRTRATWVFTYGDVTTARPETHFIVLDDKDLRRTPHAIEIQFLFPNAVSPISLGYNSDQRFIALGLSEIQVTKIAKAEPRP